MLAVIRRAFRKRRSRGRGVHSRPTRGRSIASPAPQAMSSPPSRCDVGVPPLCGDRRRLAVPRFPDHRDAAAALRACRLCAGAELPAVSNGDAVSQPHPLVGHGAWPDRRRDPDLRHRGRARISPIAPPRRRSSTRFSAWCSSCCCSRRRGAPPAGSFRSWRWRSSPIPISARICRSMDPPRLRHRPARRPSVHHAGRHLRRSGRRVVVAHHPVHDLRLVPAAFRRREVLHRLLDGADGQQGQQRRPHRGAVLVPARRSVGLRRRHHGDDRRRRLSDDAARGLREERGRRIARGGRTRARSSRRRCSAPPPS